MHLDILPSARLYRYPTPEANRKVVKSVTATFVAMSTSASPAGELTFGLLDTYTSAPSKDEAEDTSEGVYYVDSRSPMPPNGRTNTHIRFDAEGAAVQVVRRSTWVASAPTASLGDNPTMSLWHELDVAPQEADSDEWSAEEQAEWDAQQWEAWEASEEWKEWEEWGETEWDESTEWDVAPADEV